MSSLTGTPGEVIRVELLGLELKVSQLVTLIKTDALKVFQLVVPSGRSVPTHEIQGEVIVHCLQGRVSLTALGGVHDLGAGQLLYYSTNEPFSVSGTVLSGYKSNSDNWLQQATWEFGVENVESA